MKAIITNSTIDEKPGRKYTTRRLISILILLIFLSGLLCFCLFINLDKFRQNTNEFESLSIPTHGGSVADYGQDPNNNVIPPISVNIIHQIITEFPATGSPLDRIGTLQAVLLTPVPTMTPDSRLPVTFTPNITPTPRTTATEIFSPSPTTLYPGSTSVILPPPMITSIPGKTKNPPQPTLNPPRPTSTHHHHDDDHDDDDDD